MSAASTFRLIDPKKNWDRGAALTLRLNNLETDLVAGDENLIGSRAVNLERNTQTQAGEDSARAVLGADTTETSVHGWRRACA